jgi:hypothetical protein
VARREAAVTGIDRDAVQAAANQLAAAGIRITWTVERLTDPQWPGRAQTYTEHLYVHIAASKHGPQATAAKVLGVLLKVCTQVHIVGTFHTDRGL